jgi:predicted ribonuclease YlaK
MTPRQPEVERTSTLQRSNLPAHRLSLIGRDSEAAELRQRVMDPETGLLTLTGTGGCGKTSLAVYVARGLLNAFADGSGSWSSHPCPIPR